MRAWLIRIATREALKAVTSRPAHAEMTEDTATVEAADAATDRLDTEQALREVLDALPELQARAWILRELGGYPYREIAERLGVPESTVRGSLAAARKRILVAMGGRR